MCTWPIHKRTILKIDFVTTSRRKIYGSWRIRGEISQNKRKKGYTIFTFLHQFSKKSVQNHHCTLDTIRNQKNITNLWIHLKEIVLLFPWVRERPGLIVQTGNRYLASPHGNAGRWWWSLRGTRCGRVNRSPHSQFNLVILLYKLNLPSKFKFYFFLFYFIFKLYIIVLVLPNIKMNPPQVFMCSPSWTLLPPPSPVFSLLFAVRWWDWMPWS